MINFSELLSGYDCFFHFYEFHDPSLFYYFTSVEISITFKRSIVIHPQLAPKQNDSWQTFYSKTVKIYAETNCNLKNSLLFLKNDVYHVLLNKDPPFNNAPYDSAKF